MDNTNEFDTEEFYSQRTLGKFDVETIIEEQQREHEDDEFDPNRYIVEG